MKNKLLWACCIQAGMIVGCGSALAQAAPAEPAAPNQAGVAAEDTNNGMADIIVTAQKREQSLQTVPVTVTALTAETLENQNMVRVVDIARTTPGLTFGQNAATQFAWVINIRGQQTIDIQAMLDPSIGIYMDGVYLPTTRGFGAEQLVDVERIEVLKGPQGTLYGRNTTGGAISIISKLPTDKLEAMVKGDIGNFATHRIAGMLNVPIAENWAIRLVGQWGETDGWARNALLNRKLTNSDTFTVRATLRGELSDTVRVLVRGDWSEGEGGGAAFLPIRLTPCATPATGGVCNASNALTAAFPAAFEFGLANGFINPADLNPATLNPAGVAAGLNAAAAAYNSLPNATLVPRNLDALISTPTYDRYKSGGVSMELSADLGPGTLKFIPAYRYFVLENRQNLSGSAYPIFDGSHLPSPHKQVSLELQYTGNALDDRLQYVLGGYYYWFSARDDVDTVALPILNPTNPGRLRAKIGKKSYAGYAQGTFEILPETHVTAGVRYTTETRTLDTNNTDAFGCNLPAALAGTTCHAFLSKDESNWSWKFGLDHRFGRELFVYANVSRGFKSGGFNQYGSRSDPNSLNPFDPEVATQYEIGFKSDPIVGVLRVNGAAYITKVKGLQRSIISNANSPQTRYQNASDSTIKGFELEALLHPAQGLNLSATLGYIDAKYDRYVTADGVNHTNQPFQQIPKWSYSLAADYELPTSFGSLSANVNWSWRSETFIYPAADAFDINRTRQPGYGLLGARVSAHVDSINAEVAVWGNNLTDTRYWANMVDFGSPGSLGHQIGAIGQPRTYGVTLKKEF